MIGGRSPSCFRRRDHWPGCLTFELFAFCGPSAFTGFLGWAPSLAAQRPPSLAGLAYIGTLDKKLLVYDEAERKLSVKYLCRESRARRLFLTINPS
jgi:hypothetical protein